MKEFSVLKRFRNISITKKLYFVVGIMALLIALELFTLWFALNTLSSVRAYVAGEGLYSKGQKDAVYFLRKYERSHDEENYRQFKSYMRVPMGDSKARMELSKPKPNLDIVRQGFLEGRNHPDDIDGMIKLVRRFHKVSYIHKAIVVWTIADSITSTKLLPIAEQLHTEISSGKPSQEKIDGLLKELDPIVENLTVLEDEFSHTLGEGARWLENLILKLLFTVALTVEISGLMLAIYMSREITKGLNEINRAAAKITKGDLKERAKVYAMDEIGIAATSLNLMTDQLEQNIIEIKKSEAERDKMIDDLMQRNKDLEQFAYIISHNLRAPVANIYGFAEILKEENNTEADRKQYVNSLTECVIKLDDVIRDLNDILQVKHTGSELKEIVSFTQTTKNILESIEHMVLDKNVIVETDFAEADEMITLKSYLYSIFYNLITNSIKYRQPGIPLIIQVSSRRYSDKIELRFKDNGIGIDLEARGEHMFGLYKRFHPNVAEGKGMGLFMTKTQVETLNGKISIRSEVNKGTEFSIEFYI